MRLKKLGLVSVACVALLVGGGCGESSPNADEIDNRNETILAAEVERLKDQLSHSQSRIVRLMSRINRLEKNVRSVVAQAETATDDDDFVSYEQFAMPSGNIYCLMSTEAVRCHISQKEWDPGTKPPDCHLDWGNVVVIEDSDVYISCGSGGALDPDTLPVLNYGESSVIGPFSCLSEQSGVKCENKDSGRGFLVSRRSFQRF